MERTYTPMSPRKSRSSKSQNVTQKSSDDVSDGSGTSLMSYKTRCFGIPLWAVATVLLVLACLFTYYIYVYKTYSEDYIKENFPKLAHIIMLSGTTSGMVFTGVVWVLFVLTVLPGKLGHSIRDGMYEQE